MTLARWSLVGTDADGQRVKLAGWGTIVSHQQPDGSWVIVLDIPQRPD